MTTSRVNAMLRAVGAATATFGVGAFLAGSATAAPWIMTFERMTTVAAGGADIANADVVDSQVVTNMWGPGSLNGIPGSDSRVSVTILAERLIPLAPVGSTGGGLDATRPAARPG